MKLRLLQSWQGHEVGGLVDVPDAEAAQLVADGVAEWPRPVPVPNKSTVTPAGSEGGASGSATTDKSDEDMLKTVLAVMSAMSKPKVRPPHKDWLALRPMVLIPCLILGWVLFAHGLDLWDTSLAVGLAYVCLSGLVWVLAAALETSFAVFLATCLSLLALVAVGTGSAALWGVFDGWNLPRVIALAGSSIAASVLVAAAAVVFAMTELLGKSFIESILPWAQMLLPMAIEWWKQRKNA